MRQLKLFPLQKFCLDADVLINLIKHYPKDIFAPMWDKIENMIIMGMVMSLFFVLFPFNSASAIQTINTSNTSVYIKAGDNDIAYGASTSIYWYP